MNALWCVPKDGKWHAVRGNFCIPDTVTKVETVCHRFVHGERLECEQRMPDCPACRDMLWGSQA